MRTLLLLTTAVALALGPALANPNLTLAAPDGALQTNHLDTGISDPLSRCGGTAPADTNCDTGQHLRLGAGTFGPGSGDGCPTACDTRLPGYTGTLVMTIVYKVWSSGAGAPQQDVTRTNTCNFNAGVVLSCVLSGSAPPSYIGPVQGQLKQFGGYVTIYTHSCQSNNLGTNTPGGSGPWQCFAWHDLFYPSA